MGVTFGEGVRGSFVESVYDFFQEGVGVFYGDGDFYRREIFIDEADLGGRYFFGEREDSTTGSSSSLRRGDDEDFLEIVSINR